MAIPFLSPIKASANIRLANSGKLFLWNDHDSNYLMYDEWRAYASSGMTIQNAAPTGSIFFQTNSTTALTLDSSQNVIAADAFTGKLQGAVSGAPDSTIWRVSGQYTNWGIFYNEGSPDKIEFKASGTVTSTIALDNGDITTSGNIYLNNNKTIFGKNTSGSNYGLLTITSGNVVKLGAYAYTSAATQIGLGDNGKFLIGTAEALSIDNSKNATFAGNITSGGGNIEVDSTMSSSPTSIIYLDVDGNNTTGGGGSIIFSTSATGGTLTNYNAQIRGVRVAGGDGGDSQLEFWTTLVSDQPAPQRRMVITKEGNADFAGDVTVGALTSGETAQLVVNNEGGVPPVAKFMSRTNKATVQISDNDTTGYISSENGLFSLGRNPGVNANNININANHKVGIGTSSPNALLDVDGGKIRISSSGTRQLEIGTDATISFGSDDNIQVRKTGTSLQFKTGGSEQMRIASDGKVGIGTTTPGQKLEVAGRIRVSSDPTIEFYEASDKRGGIQWNTTNDYTNIFAVGGDIRFDIGGEKMRIVSNGNIGIGTTTPTNFGTGSHLITVQSASGGGYGGFIAKTDNVTGQLWANEGGSNVYLGTRSNHPLILTINNLEKARIDTAGNVGIGTVTPQEKLHVYHAGTARVEVEGTDGPAAFKATNSQGSFGWYVPGDANKFNLWNFGTSADLIEVDASGNATFAGSITGKDNGIIIDSISGPFGRIHGTSSIFLGGGSTTLVQLSSNLVPDGNNSRTLGTSSRYWGETFTSGVTSGGNIVINSNTPVLTLGVINSSTGNSKIQFYSKNSGNANGFAIQYNKDTNIDRLEFIDGGGTAAFQFHNGGNAEFEGSLTASQINTGQGATEVHLMNQNLRTSDNVQFADLTVTGNITVTGDLNTVSVTDLDVSDKTITVGVGQDEGHSGGSGLKVSGPSTQPSILWDEGNDTWDFNYGINVGGHIELDSAKGVVFDNGNSNNAWYIRNGGSNSATLQFGLGASPGSNIKHTFEGNGAVSFATYVNAATGFRMASGQAIDFIDSNIGYNSIERNTSVGGLQINTGGTASMNILDDGKVGIGTTTPGDMLHIHATGNGNKALIVEDDARRIELGRDQIVAKSADGSTVQNLYIQPSGDTGFATSSGSVGIGTALPAYKLDVAGEIKSDGYRIDLSGGTERAITSIGTDSIQFGDAGVNELKFKNTAGTSMIIASGGKVGIGIAAPTAELHVEGNLELQSNWQVGSNSGDYWQRIRTVDSSSATAQAFNFETRNGSGSFITHATILNNGNVGVGIAPVAKLHVYQNNSDDDTTAGVTIEQDGTGDAALSFLLTGIRRWKLGIDNNDSDKFKISSATNLATNNKLTIDVDGKVGIGTTSPSRTLHIAGTGGSSGGIMIAPTSGDAEIQFQDSGTTNAYITLDDGTQDLNFRDDSATVMTIDFASERVGIGTTAPTNPLHVKNDDSSGGNSYSLIKVENGTNHAEFGALSGYARIRAAGNEIMAGSWGATYFYNSGVTGLTLTGSKTGILTTTPTYTLSVNGAISGSGFVTYTKNYSSLNATGNAVAGITAAANGNGSSCGFTFTCFGGLGKYQKVVYSCYNDGGTWRTKKVINEGTNDLDVAASADGSTITFTFKATSSSQSYTPRVKVEAEGQNINSTYA